MATFLENALVRMGATPDRIAFANAAGEKVTYGELATTSGRLAAYLASEDRRGEPVVLYGHKSPLMLVGVIACMRAGRPYAPCDVAFPAARVESIISQLANPLVLDTKGEGLAFAGAREVVGPERLASFLAQGPSQVDPTLALEGDDITYLLFTSGSTGTPKGVAQRMETLDVLSDFYRHYLPQGTTPQNPCVTFNRTPWSFDVSLFDLAMALPYGNTMFSLEESTERSFSKMFGALAASNAGVWVSTPSFVEMCLADPSFNQELMPQVRTFVLAGEVLYNATCLKIIDRFPLAHLWNSYGPTETQAMADIEVTREMALADEAIPIGYVSPFAQAVVGDRETGAEVPRGRHGELFVFGRSLAACYHGRPDLTENAFRDLPCPDGTMRRSYATGDEVYMDGDGLLHYVGRYDLQLKINGFRIEIAEVEKALGAQPEVGLCCVVPAKRNGRPSHLVAHVVPVKGVDAGRALTKSLKSRLKESLPAYMVPHTFVYDEELPSNANGKIDRKLLTHLHEK